MCKQLFPLWSQCDSCNLVSRSTIKTGLRFLKGQKQTHAISIRHLGNYFHFNKIWMVFQCSNICSFFSRCFCTYHLLYWLRQKFCSSHQTNLPPTSKTQGWNPMMGSSRQMQPFLVAGVFQPASCKLMRSLTSFLGHKQLQRTGLKF